MLLARRMCEAIGEPPAKYTGYSWRIGIATDLVVQLGHEEAARVTKRRGRWFSEIFHIYQRSDVVEQLQSSAGLMDVTSVTLESLLPRWVQPARRWAP